MKQSWGLIIMIMVLCFSSNAFSENKQYSNYDAYFDSATGHKYIKTTPTTYAEYSKRGKLLNPHVKSTQPHLSTSKYIQPIKPGCYILYEKKQAASPKLLVLPAKEQHPKGWYASKLLYPATIARAD